MAESTPDPNAEGPAEGQPTGFAAWLRRYAWSLGPLVAFLALLGAIMVSGAAGRQPPGGRLAIRAATASDVVAAVRASGARGQTLVLFDDGINTMDKDERYQNLLDGPFSRLRDTADETNLTSALISSGAIRRVVVMLPDAEWAARLSQFDSAWDFVRAREGFRLRFAGEPIEVFAASRPPALPRGERAIVLIDAAVESSYPPGLVDRWTKPNVTDLVIRQGAGSD